MPPTTEMIAARGALHALPRKRLTPTTQRCKFCGEDVGPGERIVRLGGAPAHVACRPAPFPSLPSAA